MIEHKSSCMILGLFIFKIQKWKVRDQGAEGLGCTYVMKRVTIFVYKIFGEKQIVFNLLNE